MSIAVEKKLKNFYILDNDINLSNTQSYNDDDYDKSNNTHSMNDKNTNYVEEKKSNNESDNHNKINIDDEFFTLFDIKDFNIKHLYALVFGISGSGKSYLVKELLTKIRKIGYYKEFILISPTEHLSHSFQCFKEHNVHSTFSDGIFRSIIDKRKKSIEKGDKKQKPVLLVIDDCAADPALRHSPALNELFISGRHINVGVIILLQNINARDSVPPPIRNNATLLLASKPRKQKDREFLVREWFSMGGEKQGNHILSTLTSDKYRFVAVDLHKFATANKYSDFVFHYKAKSIKESDKISTNNILEKSYDDNDNDVNLKANDSKVLAQLFI